MIVLLLSLAPALAQDDPWGTIEPDDEPWDVPSDEPTSEEPAPDAPPAAEPPAGERAAEEPAEEQPARRAPVERSPGEGQVPEGWRVAPFAPHTGAKVGQELVVGGTGGTNATLVSARWSNAQLGFAVGVPFTAYRTPDGRTTDLGNLQLDGWYRLGQMGSMEQTVGLEIHARVAEPAWTWTNRADDLWPGYGADVVWQALSTPNDKTSVVYRASLGAHGAQGYEPYPASYVRFGGAALIDRTLSSRVGLVGEASFSYWDLSPFELTGLVRVDPLPGVRARAGFVMPAFVWFGWSPSDQAPGLRETTAVLDLSVVL